MSSLKYEYIKYLENKIEAIRNWKKENSRWIIDQDALEELTKLLAEDSEK